MLDGSGYDFLIAFNNITASSSQVSQPLRRLYQLLNISLVLSYSGYEEITKSWHGSSMASVHWTETMLIISINSSSDWCYTGITGSSGISIYSLPAPSSQQNKPWLLLNFFLSRPFWRMITCGFGHGKEKEKQDTCWQEHPIFSNQGALGQ